MATFATLRTNVQNNIIDLPASIVGRTGDLINRAIRRAQERHHFEVSGAILLPVTSVGGRNLSLPKPPNFIAFKDKPYGITFVGGRVYNIVVSPSRLQVNRMVTADREGQPKFILLSEPTDALNSQNIEAWPLPDGRSDYPDGEYRVNIPYWGYVPDLVNDNDENWFTQKGEDYIECKATAEAFWREHDLENSKDWETRAETYWRDLLTADNLIKLSGINTMVPHLGTRDPMLEN